MTPGTPGDDEAPAGRLGAGLLAAVAVSLAAVIGLGWLMHHTYGNRADAVADPGLMSVLRIERADVDSSRAGDAVGDGTVEALEAAPEEDQERVAAQLEAATMMANAFLNIQYENIEANIEAVKALATGPFLRQYTKASEDLVKLTRRAQATQTGEVEWAGLVTGDEDSATVIVATSGTIANKLTEFEPNARTYRLQLEVDYVDGQWLTSDLQYVR